MFLIRMIFASFMTAANQLASLSLPLKEMIAFLLDMGGFMKGENHDTRVSELFRVVLLDICRVLFLVGFEYIRTLYNIFPESGLELYRLV